MANETRFSIRRSIRLPQFDYAATFAYFITLVTQGRECLFGDVIDQAMQLNGFGEIVQAEWERSAKIRSEVSLDTFVVMPNHIHGIVLISGRDKASRGDEPKESRFTLPSKSLGSFVGGFKSGATTGLID